VREGNQAIPAHVAARRLEGNRLALVTLALTPKNDEELTVTPGDHLGIFANNRPIAVAQVLDKLYGILNSNEDLGNLLYTVCTICKQLFHCYHFDWFVLSAEWTEQAMEGNVDDDKFGEVLAHELYCYHKRLYGIIALI